MRSRLSKTAAAFAICFGCWGNISQARLVPLSLLDDILLCLNAVKDSVRTRESLGFKQREGKVSGEIGHLGEPPSLLFSSEFRGGTEVTTCKGSYRKSSISRLTDVRDAADRFDLIEIRLKSPGLYFADCHNMPNATFSLSIPFERGSVQPKSFLVSKSPTVGAVCAHSYGMQ